ncbi:hypothetical protein GF362_06640 [Candidatus Dojkabacteria bacterium]|nr:hypothetical protein [Candidatus Dojkabacteria bacterium]
MRNKLLDDIKTMKTRISNIYRKTKNLENFNKLNHKELQEVILEIKTLQRDVFMLKSQYVEYSQLTQKISDNNIN